MLCLLREFVVEFRTAYILRGCEKLGHMGYEYIINDQSIADTISRQPFGSNRNTRISRLERTAMRTEQTFSWSVWIKKQDLDIETRRQELLWIDQAFSWTVWIKQENQDIETRKERVSVNTEQVFRVNEQIIIIIIIIITIIVVIN